MCLQWRLCSTVPIVSWNSNTKDGHYKNAYTEITGDSKEDNLQGKEEWPRVESLLLIAVLCVAFRRVNLSQRSPVISTYLTQICWHLIANVWNDCRFHYSVFVWIQHRPLCQMRYKQQTSLFMEIYHEVFVIWEIAMPNTPPIFCHLLNLIPFLPFGQSFPLASRASAVSQAPGPAHPGLPPVLGSHLKSKDIVPLFRNRAYNNSQKIMIYHNNNNDHNNSNNVHL